MFYYYRKLLFIITNVSAWTNAFLSSDTPLVINKKISSPLNNQHLAIAAIEVFHYFSCLELFEKTLTFTRRVKLEIGWLVLESIRF